MSAPKLVLFYDSPEYIELIANNSFLSSVQKGHPPIHPLFMAVLWLFSHGLRTFGISWEYSGNLLSVFLGMFSVFLFFHLTKYFFLSRRGSAGLRLSATFLFAFFPAIWIANSNLLVESLQLPLFLWSAIAVMKLTGSKQSSSDFIGLQLTLSLILLLTTHVQSLLWLPALLGIPLLTRTPIEKGKVKTIVEIIIAAFLIACTIYAFIFYNSGKPVLGSLKELFTGRIGDHIYSANLYKAVLLGIRNAVLVALRGFSSGIIFIFVFATMKKRNDKRFIAGIFLFCISFLLSGSLWYGDIMVRRAVFAAVFTALVTTEFLGKRTKYAFLYLFPVIYFNIILIAKNIPQTVLKSGISHLPPKQILLETHYLKPFIKYDGKTFWLGETDPDFLTFLKSDSSEVYLDSQAIFAPYLMYSGPNLHLTSLGKFGTSENQYLFRKFSASVVQVGNPSQRIYQLQLTEKINKYSGEKEKLNKLANGNASFLIGKAPPGSPVFLYSNNFSERIHRQRIDFGDLLTWAYIIIVDRKEPVTWTYADKSGIFEIPVEKNRNDFYLVSGGKISFEKISNDN